MTNIYSAKLLCALAIIIGLLGFAIQGRAVQYQQIYSFGGKPDGATASSPLLVTKDGVLYGTTEAGGAFNSGTVFAVTPPVTAGGSSTESVIWSFGAGSDGRFPYGAGSLLMDANDNLYGTTDVGGTLSDGTAFGLTPSGGSWTESILWDFSLEGEPFGGLLRTSDGNLYGVTLNGGAKGFGTIFAIPPGGTLHILHNFTGNPDGGFPYAGFLREAGDVLYSTTDVGGSGMGIGCGTVYQVTIDAGTVNEKVLYSFHGLFNGGSDGCNPRADVISDKNGVLYGTTTTGGSGSGTVFSLTPPAIAGGSWTETILYSFAGAPDGIYPQGTLAMGSDGTLYGATAAGGVGDGIVFSLTPPAVAGGTWTEAILHTFASGRDGAGPVGGLTLHNGVLYGATPSGGAHNKGTVYGIVP